MPSDSNDVDIELTPGTTKSEIIALLYNNPDDGFSADDIQDQLDVTNGTVTTTLTHLNINGLIGKTENKYYHALNHRDDLRRYVGSLNQLERMFDDKDYDEYTDVDDSHLEDIDEDELDAEIAELEADLNQEYRTK
jgi:DNA-binding MarR family transcriptional regulator